MSILIKGMDMPKKDTGCRIIILYDGQVAMDNGTFIPDYKAVEIPTPHGRLIDADDSMKHLADDGREAFTKSQVWLLFSEYGAPTILEAENRPTAEILVRPTATSSTEVPWWILEAEE